MTRSRLFRARLRDPRLAGGMPSQLPSSGWNTGAYRSKLWYMRSSLAAIAVPCLAAQGDRGSVAALPLTPRPRFAAALTELGTRRSVEPENEGLPLFVSPCTVERSMPAGPLRHHLVLDPARSSSGYRQPGVCAPNAAISCVPGRHPADAR